MSQIPKEVQELKNNPIMFVLHRTKLMIAHSKCEVVIVFCTTCDIHPKALGLLQKSLQSAIENVTVNLSSEGQKSFLEEHLIYHTIDIIAHH